MPVTFDSLRSPCGTPCRRAAKNAVSTAEKVTKNAVSLTAKLNHDGCISQCFLSSSSRRVIAKRYRGNFLNYNSHVIFWCFAFLFKF